MALYRRNTRFDAHSAPAGSIYLSCYMWAINTIWVRGVFFVFFIPVSRHPLWGRLTHSTVDKLAREYAGGLLC